MDNCPVCKSSLANAEYDSIKKPFAMPNMKHFWCENISEHYSSIVVKNKLASETISFFHEDKKYCLSFSRSDYFSGPIMVRVQIFHCEEDESMPSEVIADFNTKCEYFDLSKFNEKYFVTKIDKVRLLK